MSKKVGLCKSSVLSHFYCIFSVIFHIIQIAECLAQYNGLNRWSFATNTGQHELFSDLLCPNPMVSWVDGSTFHKSHPLDENSLSQDSFIPRNSNKNEVWTFKSPNELVTLPCKLGKSSAEGGGRGKGNLQSILFINVTYEPFDFTGAKECARFIKLNYDELDGVELNCEDDNKEVERVTSREKSYIHWPEYIPKRSKYFSIYQNLENFLRHEEHLKTRFFFQIYLYSVNGSFEICKVQQYELDFRRPEGCTQPYDETSVGQNHKKLNRRLLPCGEYPCSNQIFSSYNVKPVKIVEIPKEIEEDSKKLHVLYYPHNSNETYRGALRLDVRSIVFLTLLPILLLGALVFGMQIFIYTTCSRRSNTASDANRDSNRSQQILQNSLNLWETLPAREPRSVSFSPVTTNIDVQLVNANQHDSVPVPELPETPKILKSALKRKSNEFFPPPPPDSDSSLYD